MATGTSVVTPERFATGLPSFKDWMAAIGQRKAEFQRHYDDFEPKADDLAFFKQQVQERGLKALVIGEDWCPDVWRGLPVMAKLQEQAGLEVRYFMRDQNKDIMSEFLNKGEFESIPTVVFYDKDHNYLGHWIERAAIVNEEMAKVRASVYPPADQMPERDTPEWTALQDKAREANIAAAGPWRQAQVEEIRQMLA